MWAKNCLRYYSSARSMKSPYEILQLPRQASQAEIKKKYYELAKTLHPDRGNNINHDSTTFQELADAYELLKQPDRRILYLKTGYGWDSTLHCQNQHAPHYHSSSTTASRPWSTYRTTDNVTYDGGPWSSHQNTRYASNTTIFCVLTGITFALSIVNFVYTPFANKWLKALDNHHAKSSRDLEKARTNAQKYGNQHAVQRVMQASSLLNNNNNNKGPSTSHDSR